MGQAAQNPFQEELINFDTVQVDDINNITILRGKQNKQQILVRKWIFNEKQECDKISSLHGLRQSSSTQHSQKLIKFTQVRTQDLCNTMHELYCMWEYQPTSLSSQIQKRLHTNKQFSQKQLTSIIISVSEALRVMQSRNERHEKITVDSIKIDDKGNIKVCDPFSLSNESNYSRVYSKHETDRIYLSPQECSALASSQPCQKSSKSDVWTFGMILIELGLLEDQNSCYRDECRRIQWNKISENLDRFGEKYSRSLRQLIQSMLAKNSDSRPGWAQIKTKITQSLRKKQQCVRACQQLKINNNKKSPQVYAYKQFSEPNSQIFPLNRQTICQMQLPPRNYNYPPPRQQVHHVNITYNQPVPINPNKENIAFALNNRPHLPPLPPLPHTINNLSSEPQIFTHLSQNQLNVPSIMSITASKINSQDNVKKFMSPASSIGFLFSGINPKQEQIQPIISQVQQKIAETHYSPSDYTSKNNYLNNKFCNNQIKNAESITYQGDFQNVLVHQFRKFEAQNKQGELVEKSNKQFQATDLKTLPAVSTEPQNPQFSQPDELEYVVQNFKVGSRYEGYKLRNMRHGEGRFYYQDGGMYDGTWYHNKMHGKGSLYYQSGGLAYEGNWKNDQFQGRGRLNNQIPQALEKNFDYRNFDNIGQAWEYYDGQFVDDMKQGRGKLMLTNGEYYVGSFKQDMIDGNGKFFSKNGVIKGVWEANQLIKIE